MSDISPSAIPESSPELQERISKAASVPEITEILHNEAIRLSLVRPDPFNKQILHAVEAPVARGFAKTLVISGQKHVIEGANETELLANENQLLQSLMSPAGAAQRVEDARVSQPHRDPNSGRFVSADEAATASAVEAYLSTRGISTDALRAVSDKAFEQSWAEATTAFLNSPAGAGWPGGEQNKTILAQIIAADNNLVDAPDKVEALTAAYNHAKEHGLLVPNEEADRLNAIASARTRAELDEALQIPDRQKHIMELQQSGLFGRR